ncbi:MAG: hypothetical protein JWN36_1000 [Microbacteriaceae bacterium]|nr:hypothetical protein [Microbacteriaceae bacterium]
MKKLTPSPSRIAAAAVALAAATVIAVTLAPATPALAHGNIGGPESSVLSRAAWSANADRGAVQFEPQSLEAPKGFPEAGPADGQLASAGGKFGGNLDEQSSTRWAKNLVSPGPLTVAWTLTAAHRTADWKYFITKPGWDQNAPLSRADFVPLATFDGHGDIPAQPTVHTLQIPADYTGYHVIYAIWDIADTGNAFYNTIDLDVEPGAVDAPPATQPTDPVTQPTQPTDPTTPVTDPTTPATPTDPVTEPTEPITPVDPTTPTTPAGPTTEWDPFAAYSVGDEVTHAGGTYVSVQGYQGHGDESYITSLALWQPLVP